jgi:hypothetical protein
VHKSAPPCPPAQFMTGKTRNIIRVVVAVLLVTPCALYVRWQMGRSRNAPVPHKVNCVNNLKQIGLAVRTWAIDNGGPYSFNVSTNAGGTLEFCARGRDGFDSNAAIHFQVMSNELSTPRLLVCPRDRSRHVAVDFHSLEPVNVTYRLRTGTNLSQAHPKEVLVVCPMDGNTLYCDGTVVSTNQSDIEKDDHAMHFPRPGP